jgi:hypothetical protein
MIYFHKSKEVLKEEHFEKDVLPITDVEYTKFKLLNGLGIINMELSEYEKYLIEDKEYFNKLVEQLATLPKLKEYENNQYKS